MNQSPVAAVTNDHKFSGLAQVAPCHRSVDQKSDLGFTRLKSKRHQGCVSFRSSEGEPTSLTFPASGDRLHPLALDIFLHLQSQPRPASHSSSLTTSSPNSSWERVFQFKKVKLAYSDIPRYSLHLNFTTSAKSLWPDEVTWSQFLGRRTWTWGATTLFNHRYQVLLPLITEKSKHLKLRTGTSPGSPVIKTLPSKAKVVSSIPGGEHKIPHVEKKKKKKPKHKTEAIL